jgi:Fe-S-cluster containining protein
MYVNMQTNQYLLNIANEYGAHAAQEEGTRIMMLIKDYTTFIASVPQGPDRADLCHAQIDALLLGMRPSIRKRITCRIGCYECCRMYVMTLPSEGALLKRFMVENNIEPSWDRARLQQGLDEDGYYTDKLQDNNKCMFLDERGRCMVYSVRPTACRLHSVVSPKSLCSMSQPERVQKTYTVDAEAFHIAWSNIERGRENKSLPETMLSLRGLI